MIPPWWKRFLEAYFGIATILSGGILACFLVIPFVWSFIYWDWSFYSKEFDIEQLSMLMNGDFWTILRGVMFFMCLPAVAMASDTNFWEREVELRKKEEREIREKEDPFNV